MRLVQIRPAVGNATHGIRKTKDRTPLSKVVIHFQNERRPALSSSRKISIVLRNGSKTHQSLDFEMRNDPPRWHRGNLKSVDEQAAVGL